MPCLHMSVGGPPLESGELACLCYLSWALHLPSYGDSVSSPVKWDNGSYSLDCKTTTTVPELWQIVN